MSAAEESALEAEHVIKVLVIGDSGVGKSALLMRFADDAFTEAFVSTIGVDFRCKLVPTRSGTAKLQIWDTAGQERFRTITAAYYRNASAVVLAYDCTSAASFDNVVAWMRGLTGALGDAGAADVTKALVATKCDAPQERRVIAAAQGEALAAAHGMAHYETSAKTGWGVEPAFTSIASDAVDALRARGATQIRPAGSLPRPVKKKRNSSSCC